MGDKTGIQWTEATWNPVTGCTKVSPGCAHCYAETVTRRFADVWGVSAAPWTPENAAEVVRIRPDRLDQPLRWKRPRLVFVNSMSDLFHEHVPDEFIREVYLRMAASPEHTFQVLTKRPERARDVLAWIDDQDEQHGANYFSRWPARNVWLGVSIENARHAYRADVLRDIPAAVRFISAEPLLGSLFEQQTPLRRRYDRDLSMEIVGVVSDESHLSLDEASSRVYWAERNGPNRIKRPLSLDGIDWVIIGGESGPRARPMRLEWARELVGECAALDVACFVKQLGSVTARDLGLRDRKAGDPDEWPADLRVREMPR